MKEEIKNIVKELQGIKLAKSHLAQLTKLREESQIKLQVLESEISKKLSKIDKLNKQTVFSLYRKLVGDKDQLLEIHKQHYLTLIFERNELRKSIEKLDFEIDIFIRKTVKYKSTISILKDKLRERNAEVHSEKLKEYKRTINNIDKKLRLTKELEEAISEGSSLNRKFNSALYYIEHRVIPTFEKEQKKDSLTQEKIDKIDKLQDHLVAIKHSSIKFEAELNDVYEHMLNRTKGKKIDFNFMGNHQINLITDMQADFNMNQTFLFLKSKKTIVLSLTRLLRSDLKKLNKEILELEKLENELINLI